MKKFVLGLVAASLIATPALAAPDSRTVTRERPNGTVVSKTIYKPMDTHRWQKGDRFDRRYVTSYRTVDYHQYRGLKAPPRGYRYVQAGNDALLVGIASGVVAAVFTNLIR